MKPKIRRLYQEAAQHMLAKLTESASHGYTEYEKPLAFSICTEGPYIELWVHYTISKNGIRLYYMNIINVCHASLLSRVMELLVMVDSVMSWASVDSGRGPLRTDILTRLRSTQRYCAIVPLDFCESTDAVLVCFWIDAIGFFYDRLFLGSWHCDSYRLIQ